jgi:hypothetical protein
VPQGHEASAQSVQEGEAGEGGQLPQAALHGLREFGAAAPVVPTTGASCVSGR